MSLSNYILSLPQWLAILLLVVVAISFSIGGFLVVHRFIPVKIRQIHNDVAGFVFATLGVTYGVMLAFVVIVVWEQFNDAKIDVANESSTALVLYKNIITYPDKAASDSMRNVYIKYISQSIEKQDLVLSEEVRTEEAMVAMNQFFLLTDGIVPVSRHEEILYTQILQNLNDLVRYRNLRHQATYEELPSVIWIGVIVGAMITIGFTFLFGTENVWAHITMMSLLASLIAVVVYVVIELDHPMMGNVKVGLPPSYSKILELAGVRP